MTGNSHSSSSLVLAAVKSPSTMDAPVVYGTTGSISALLDGTVTRDILDGCSDIGGKCVAEYVWIGGSGADLRSKARFAFLSHPSPRSMHFYFQVCNRFCALASSRAQCGCQPRTRVVGVQNH